MMNFKNTYLRRFILQVSILISALFMCSFVFAETLIELEVGYEALEEYMTFQLLPGEYQSLDEAIVTVDENGLVVAKRFGDTKIVKYENEDIVEIFEVIVYLVGDEPVPWGAANIQKPYISGYPDQKFKPKKYITRAEMATIFSKILQLSYSEPCIFIDVIDSHWAYDYIQSITTHQLMSQRLPEEFYPDANLTRAEFAAVISKYSSHQGLTLNDEMKEPIADVSFDDIYFKAVHQTVNTKLLLLEEGLFRPNDFIKREEAVRIINIIIDKQAVSFDQPKFTDVEESNPYYNDIYKACY